MRIEPGNLTPGGSGASATLALALSWGPNALSLYAFQRGILRLPRFLIRVHPIEPMIYQCLGTGLVKRIVVSPLWYRFVGDQPPPRSDSRQELLDRAELTTKGAEVCHGATFIAILVVALLFMAAGRAADAIWILAFNVMLNAYPVMLQRVNRYRIHRVRESIDLRRV